MVILKKPTDKFCIHCKHKFECLTDSYIICSAKYCVSSVRTDLSNTDLSSSGSSASAIPGKEVKYYSYEPRGQNED